MQELLAGDSTMVHGRKIGKDEVQLVNKAIAAEMAKISAGKARTYTLRQMKEKLGP